MKPHNVNVNVAYPASHAGARIPKIIHQVWLGGPLPDEFERYARAWQAMHPDWEYRLWTEKDLGWLRHAREFASVPKLSTKSNIARYEVMWRFGGAYLDTDFEPLKPIDDAISDASMVVCPERPDLFCNAFFAASPQHPIMGYLLDQLAESISANFNRPSPEMCGPVFFTRAVKRGAAVTGVPFTSVSRQSFYPYNFDQGQFDDEGDFPGAMAVHRWAKSWREPTPPKQPLTGGTSWLRPKQKLRALAHQTIERLHAKLRKLDRKTGRQFGEAVYLGSGRVLVNAGRFPLLIPSDDLNILPALLFRGESDADYLAFLSRHLRPSDRVLDIGANIGYTVLAAAWCLGPYGRIDAFEPSPECLEILRDNIYMNRMLGAQPEILVHDFAVGSIEGERELVFSRKHRGRGSLNASAQLNLASDGLGTVRKKVRVRRLESILRDVTHIRLAKIDVEGLEQEVLEALEILIASRRIDYIDFELNDGHSGSCWDRLEATLRRFETAYSCNFAAITRAGTLEARPLGQILQGGNLQHVIISLCD